MKAFRLFFLLTISTFFVFTTYSQKKYQGIIVTKLGDEQKGIITVNLDGPNSELLEIAYTKKFSAKLNIALINHIVIHDTTYYFRDIKYDYASKYYMNVPVRLIEGTLECGMFQTGRSTAQNTIAVKLPNDEYSKLISPEFDYYKATMGWHLMAFGKCPSLSSKMSNKDDGYKWDDNTPQDQRIIMWKNWIKEFNNCK